jgi:hypothetical protein
MAPAIAATASNLFRMFQLPAMDAHRLAGAQSSQFAAQDIVPRKPSRPPLQFSAFFAGAGTH